MNTKLKKLKEELDHQYKRFNICEDPNEIDAIIFRMKSLELEMSVLLNEAKKTEKEPIETPKKLKKFFSTLLYPIKGGM